MLLVSHSWSFSAYLIEEESSACGSCEARGDELRPIRQDRVAVGTREEARPANVI